MKKSRGTLIVRERKDGPRWYGTWRDSNESQRTRLIGPAWLQKKESASNPFAERVRDPGNDAWQAIWAKRRDRCPGGFLTHTDALKALDAMVDEHEAELERERAASEDVLTFSKVADEWLAERQRDAKDGYLKRSTYKDYRSMLRHEGDPVRPRGKEPTAWFHKVLGKKPIADITVADIDDFEAQVRDAGRSARTVKKYLTVLSMILDYAVRKGHLETNPMTIRPRAKPARRRRPLIEVYDLDTVELIAQACKEPIDDMIRLSALTGLRQGELLALRWRNVDFLARAIRAPKTYGGVDVGEDEPKSGAARTVPMSDQAALVLDRLKPDNARPSWLVFHRGNPKVHIDASAVRRAYEKARNSVLAAQAKDGVELPTINFHGLRHTFGTRCAAQGIPLPTIQRWMGHADIQTTMKYIHWVPQHDDAERLTRAQLNSAAPSQDLELLVEEA